MHRIRRPFRPLLLASLALLSACWQSNTRTLTGQEHRAPDDFSFLGRTAACFLEVQPQTEARAIRVNCFHIDGVLHIHSNRFAKMPRFRGESWVDTIRREPDVRVAIDGKIYPMRASPIDDEDQRVALLHDRGYVVAWDGITVFSFARRSLRSLRSLRAKGSGRTSAGLLGVVRVCGISGTT